MKKLPKEIEKGEITKCLRNLKNSKTGGSDGIVGELLKYGGFGMVDLLEQLFSVIWQEEIVPRQWREGLINPRCACAARVIVVVVYVCMCVCVCVCVTTHNCRLTHWNHKTEIPTCSQQYSDRFKFRRFS